MLKWIFLLCAALAFLAWMQSPALPPPSQLLAELLREPTQVPVEPAPYKTTVAGVTYSIEPSHRYDIYGLVVSKHNANTWWNWAHAAWNDHLNVTDVCVLWGTNLASGVYQAFSFSSGQWTCNYQTTSSAAYQAFDPARFSNNHMLTDSPPLARKLRQLRIGDQVHITGHLAAYRHQAGQDFFRGTSTTRQDTGNFSCETIFVTDVAVLRSAPTGWRTLSWLAGLGMGVCMLIGLARPYRTRG